MLAARILYEGLSQFLAGLVTRISTSPVPQEPKEYVRPGLLVCTDAGDMAVVGITIDYELTSSRRAVLLKVAPNNFRLLPLPEPESRRILGTPEEYIARHKPALNALAATCRNTNLLLLASLHESGIPPERAPKGVRRYWQVLDLLLHR